MTHSGTTGLSVLMREVLESLSTNGEKGTEEQGQES